MGLLRYDLTDVPPQSNSPYDNVFGPPDRTPQSWLIVSQSHPLPPHVRSSDKQPTGANRTQLRTPTPSMQNARTQQHQHWHVLHCQYSRHMYIVSTPLH
nr:hypothetical transcript [Hymenolepis microstoma]